MGDGSWLLDNIRREVGDGSCTLFRRDAWLNGVLLNIRFSGLSICICQGRGWEGKLGSGVGLCLLGRKS